MDTWSIKTFLTLAEVKRLSICAERLCITKSAVSSRIKQLESQLDQSLFERSTQGMTLTLAGERFYQHAQIMQQRWEHAKADVKRSEQSAGTLRIATHNTLASDFLPRWGSELRRHDPQLTLHMSAYYSSEIVAQVAAGTLDIGLIFVADATAGLIVEQAFADDLIMVASKPLLTHQITAEDYLYIDWGWGYNAAHSERLPHLQNSLQTCGLGEAGLPWLLANGGCAYLPKRTVQSYLQSRRLYQVTDAPVFERPVFATYAREPHNPALVRQASDALKIFTR
ncbi:LysR family transcriptional regulator [Aliamphritea hakodatensis]|uniref:LysR family transcriptional regulator n=1 Tax=Aliamphritea hakodatensis TaxID=2895352 RepID=UPI0022FD7618|nr:LysR family transcriptional regulator [Aliamphritea hakodatensis]